MRKRVKESEVIREDELEEEGGMLERPRPQVKGVPVGPVPKEKLYTCWECHEKKFTAFELVGHRCQKCRDERVALRNEIGSITPWKAEGLERAKRVGKLGPQGGPQWRSRKKPIKKPRTIVLLAKNKRLPTWNDNWKPKEPKSGAASQSPKYAKRSRTRKRYDKKRRDEED